MKISRREFLQYASAMGGALLLPHAAFAGNAASSKTFIVGRDSEVCIFSLSSHAFTAVRSLDVGFKPHSFLQNPKHANRIWTIQRYDNDKDLPQSYRAVEFNLSDGTIGREITAPQGSKFRGHGFFLPDSETLFISRIIGEEKAGYLTGYDVSSDVPKQIANYRIGNTWVHDCVIKEGGNVFIAAAGLATDIAVAEPTQLHSGVSHMDIASGKILSHTPLDSDRHHVSHLQVSSDGMIVTCGKSFKGSNIPGGVFVGRAGERSLGLIAVPGEAPLISEKFGVAINEHKNIVAATDNEQKHIVVIDLATRKFLYDMKSDVALGLLYDAQAGRFVSNGDSLSVYDQSMRSVLLAQSKASAASFNVGHALLI